MRGRKIKTIEDYQRAIKNGFGLGSGSSYKRWIDIKDFPSTGRASKIQGNTTSRKHELFSDIETRIFLALDFDSDVVDIREQFPLLPLDAVMKVAQRAGIKYTTIPGSKVPHIFTTDFMVTKKLNNNFVYHAIAAKPSCELIKVQVREKLEIERIWWSCLGIDWSIATESSVSEAKAENLAWISKQMNSEVELKSISLEEIYELRNQLTSSAYTLEALYHHMQKYAGCISVEQSKKTFCWLVWNKMIEINLEYKFLEKGIIEVISWNEDIEAYEAMYHENIA